MCGGGGAGFCGGSYVFLWVFFIGIVGVKVLFIKNPEGVAIDLGGCDLGHLEGDKWLYFQ